MAGQFEGIPAVCGSAVKDRRCSRKAA